MADDKFHKKKGESGKKGLANRKMTDYDSDEPAVAVGASASSAPKRGSKRQKNRVNHDTPTATDAIAASSEMKKVVVPLETIGSLDQSGPIHYVRNHDNGLSDDIEKLLELEAVQLDAPSDGGMLSESELDLVAGKIVVANEEEVIAVSGDDSRNAGVPMDISGDEHEEDVARFVRDPSLPLEETHPVEVKASVVQTPLCSTKIDDTSKEVYRVDLSKELVDALKLIPGLVEKAEVGFQAMKHLDNILDPKTSPFVQKKELNHFVTFESLKSVLINRPPIPEAGVSQELSNLLAPLQSLEDFKATLKELSGSLGETLSTTRGCAGKMEEIKSGNSEESKKLAVAMKNLVEIGEEMKGCIRSMQTYVLRKTTQLDVESRSGPSRGPATVASSSAINTAIANVGELLGSAQTYERKQAQKKVEKGIAEAIAKAKPKPKEMKPCVYCQSTLHNRHSCSVLPSAEARRLFLASHQRCFICFSNRCDGTEGQCPEKRRRLCQRCSNQPIASRVHDSSLCVKPNPAKESALATVSTAIHSASEASKNGIQKAQKRSQSSASGGSNTAKRVRPNARLVDAPPLFGAREERIDDAPSTSGVIEQPAQDLKKKKRKRSRAKKHHKENDDNASKA